MPKYYHDDGRELKGNELKKYLKAIKTSQTTGKPLVGPKYPTREELQQRYNGFDISIIRKAGKDRAMLNEMPKMYTAQTDEQMQAAASAQAEADANMQMQQAGTLYNANKSTLEAQKAALDQPYQQQLQQNSRQTAQTVDSLTGAMAARGLLRSTHAGALQSNSLQAGNASANAILQEKAGKATAIDTQLGNQGTSYNSALDMIGKNKASGIKTAFDALKQQNYSMGMDTSNARLAALNNLWASKKKVGSGGGGGGGGSYSSNSGGGNDTQQQGGGFVDWLKDWFSMG